MIKHYIIIASAYSIGKRIALDYYSEDILSMEIIQKDIDYIMDKCGKDVPISSHFVQVEEKGWDAVRKKDKFFDGVKLVATKEEFVKLILADQKLLGIDIAKYILTKKTCTHLKLEKLVYMCYADYLCKEDAKLFDDTIYAYRLGPVIKTVYEKYKKKRTLLSKEPAVEDDKIMYDRQEEKMQIKSRILASKDGLKKIISIDQTLDKFGDYTATQLVDITHKKTSPWYKVGCGEIKDQIISDEMIKKYHKYEKM